MVNDVFFLRIVLGPGWRWVESNNETIVCTVASKIIMTINEGADSNVDLTAINRLQDDEVCAMKNTEKSYEPSRTRGGEESQFLTNVENSKISILPEKYKSSKTNQPPDEFNHSNCTKNHDSQDDQDADEHSPPDGGIRAWMIMLGSFLINGILFSVINTYSLIYVELLKRLEESGETEASSKAGMFQIFLSNKKLISIKPSTAV